MRVSMVKGGQIRAGGKEYGSGSFVPYDTKTKTYDTSKKQALGTKGVRDTAKSVVDTYQVKNPSGKREPVILSTINGKTNFESNIMPTITKANEGLANLGIEDTTTKTGEGDKLDPMLQQEYDATLTPEQKASNDYIASLEKQSEAAINAYDQMSKAAARTARASAQTLKQQYNERKQLLEESNKAELTTAQQQFIRTGQTEYSPTMTAGFLSAKEREGQARIQTLNDKYMSAVDEVNAALEEKQYSIAANKAKTIQEIEESIRTEIKAQAKLAKEENERITAEIEQRRITGLITDQLRSGATDPIAMFTALDGTVPFDEILKYTKELPKPEADFTLSEGQARYDASGKLIASRAKTYAPSTMAGAGGLSGSPLGADVPQDIKDAAQSIYDGKSKLNEYPSALRLAINSYMTTLYKAEGGDQLAQGAYDAAVSLKDHGGFSGAVGTNLMLGFGKQIPGSQSAGFISALDQLKANLKLVNIKYLKGTGALSDAEGKTLEDASTSLNPSLPEQDFAKELDRVIKALKKTNNVSQDYGYANSSNSSLLNDSEDEEETFEDPNNIYQS